MIMPGLAMLALMPGVEMAAGMMERPEREALEAMWRGPVPVRGLHVLEPGRRLRGRVNGRLIEARMRGLSPLRPSLEVQLYPVPLDAQRWGVSLSSFSNRRWTQRGARLLGSGRPSPVEFEELLHEGIWIANELERRTVAPWQAFAQKYRLKLRGGVTHWAEAARLRLVGTIQGVDVEVVLLPYLERLRTEVRVRVPGGLPGRLRIYRRGERVVNRQHRPPVDLQDPILNDRIIAYGWLETDGRARLCRPEVRGLLLEVLMGYPGSRILDDTVILRVRDVLIQPAEMVDAAIELACALGKTHQNARRG
ncbi:MAG: hypothetical protein AAFV53_32550 [Myxococcota bacterium]